MKDHSDADSVSTQAGAESHPLEERNHHGTPFDSVLRARISRRDALSGGLGVAAGTVFAGAGLSACSDNSSGHGDSGNGDETRPELKFSSVKGVSGAEVNDLQLPEGYTWEALLPWGTGILGRFPGFNADGSNTAEEQNQQTGEWHDGMKFFPMPGDDSQGVLVLNHERLEMLFFHGYSLDGNGDPVSHRSEDQNGLPTDVGQVRKEIAGHGVSVVALKRMGNRWRVTSNDMNRRVTADTPVTFSGPAAGAAVLQTKFSPGGTRGRGTINNCGRGYTPWNTYLTCEENFRGYLTTREDPRPEEKQRYLINESGFGYLWHGVAGDASEVDHEFARWDTTPGSDSATDDFRNEANHFGWIVEIDPFDPNSTPKKRTAMGRFAHEGAQPGRVEAGRPIAFYMGDDDENEYIYKFVTAEHWDPEHPDPDMLDDGTLYAARFNPGGTGEWLPLDIDQSEVLANRFNNQAEVLTYARIAADELGATPMDRPEWSATDPNTGEIYFTLTNNDEKGDDPDSPNAANPRDPNEFGHVIRHRERDDEPGAESFMWDIFVFGAPAGGTADINRSELTEGNQFGGPDGLWFDPRGVLWIETDNGGNAVADATNDQLLAVIPARLGEQRSVKSGATGPAITGDNQGELKRFMVGPGRCEVTGIELTPDNKTLFVNIQHPGQAFGSAPSNSFPNLNGDGGPHALPRSTTVAIRRLDGGDIAL